MTEITNRTIALDNDDLEEAEYAVEGLEDELVQLAMDNRGYKQMEVEITVRATTGGEQS